MNVLEKGPKVPILFDEKGFVAALKEMPYAAMAPVEALGVVRLDIEHHSRKADRTALQDQVHVIVHQAIGVDEETEARPANGKPFEESLPIDVVAKDRTPLVAASDDMIDGTLKVQPERAWHVSPNGRGSLSSSLS
jgi:hypothetical protein